MKNFKEAIARPRKVALYAHLTIDDFYSLDEVRIVNYDEHFDTLPDGQTREVSREGYVRITELAEVTLSPIDNDAIVRNAVVSLDEQERQLRAELNKKIAEIQDRRNQLLALTYQPELQV